MVMFQNDTQQEATAVDPCPSVLLSVFRLTALVVKTLSMAEPLPQPVSVDHQALSESVAWLIRKAQQADGSFADKSPFRPNKVVVSGTPLILLLLLLLLPQFDFPFFQIRFRDPAHRRCSLPDWLQAAAGVEHSVYLTSFVLIALHKATSIRDPILQLRVRICPPCHFLFLSSLSFQTTSNSYSALSPSPLSSTMTA